MTDLAPPQKVALLALLYTELCNAHYTSPQSLLDDMETCPGELSLLLEMGSQGLAELDWHIVKTMEEQPDSLLALATDVHAIDPTRAEAILHAWPGGSPPWGGASWTHPYCSPSRLEAVWAAKRDLEGHGITAKRDDVELAVAASFEGP